MWIFKIYGPERSGSSTQESMDFLFFNSTVDKIISDTIRIEIEIEIKVKQKGMFKVRIKRGCL